MFAAHYRLVFMLFYHSLHICITYCKLSVKLLCCPLDAFTYTAFLASMNPCANCFSLFFSLIIATQGKAFTFIKKAREVASSPLLPPYTPKASYISFGMWGRVLDVINRAEFQLDRFRDFVAPGGRKSLSPIDWRYRPYNSVRTTVLHCDCDCLFLLY